MEYVPEKAELDGDLDEEFRKVFEKFTFKEISGPEVMCSFLYSSCSYLADVSF